MPQRHSLAGRRKSAAAGATLAIAAALATAMGGAARSQSCDRDCLESWVETYLDAVVENDPAAAMLADDVRFTANGQRLAIGDGLWRTMQAKGAYRVVVADVPAQQVAAMSTFVEDGQGPDGVGAVIAVRLKIADGRIAEIEQKELREPEAYQLLEESGGPRSALAEAVAPAERMSRAGLIETANKYFAGIQQNDGLGDYGFLDFCHRQTNGRLSTRAPGVAAEDDPEGRSTCQEQFESGQLHFVSRIRDRRFVAVDQERGLVFAFGFFDHFAGDTRHFTLPDGTETTGGPTVPWTWSIAEIFKIRDGVIHEVEALELRRPYGMLSGWTDWETGMSDAVQDATGVPAE